MTTHTNGSFVDLAVSRRLELAEGRGNVEFVEGRAMAFPERGACWIQVAGACAMFDGIDSPLTQTFGLGITRLPTATELNEIESFYAALHAPVFHEVSPLAGADLGAMLAERGYRPVEYSNVLLRSLVSDQAPAIFPSSVSVRAIETGEHELWSETASAGWKEYGPEIAAFTLEVGQVNRVRPTALSYLAEINGQAVATGSMNLQDGVALLAGASTVPAFRKRGAQNALLEFRLHHAKSQGCDLAMMCTEPGSGSQRNAERRGFRVVYTRTKWWKTVP